MTQTEHPERTAVLILNWNGRAWLEQFLSGVVSNSSNAEVIVADNGSTDDSVNWLQSNFPGLRVLELDDNYGFAGGYNKAIEMINHSFVVLLNNDVRVSEGWLHSPLQYLEDHPECAAVQPKILSHDTPTAFEYAGASGGVIDCFGYPFCRGRIFDHVEQDEGQYDKPMPVLWASGAAMIMRRKSFIEAGGFDEDFFAHMEEIDLCWRLRRMGFSIVCIPDTRVWHVGGGSLKRGAPDKTYLNFRNSLITLHKNAASSVWLLIVARLLFDGLAAIKFLISDGPAHFLAIIRAHGSYFWSVGKTMRKRKALKAKNAARPMEGILRGSIVVLYYVRKVRRFSDIQGKYWNRKGKIGRQ